MPAKRTVYRRDELYESVWSEPMVKVAAKYGVSSVALAKTCGRLAVPVPGRGYWARRKAGQNVARPPLLAAPPGVPNQLPVRRVALARPRQPTPREPDERITQERSASAAIVVPETLERPHLLVRDARRLFRSAMPDRDGLLRVGVTACLDLHVSAAALDRALRILQAVIEACTARGMPVEQTPVTRARRYGSNSEVTPSNVTRIRVDGEWVQISLREKYSVTRSTERPPRELDVAGRHLWELRRTRTIRTPNGTFELRLESPVTGAATFVDRKNQPLERQLNEVFVAIYRIAADVRTRRAERAAAARLAQEDARTREREESIANEEKRREGVVTESVNAWRMTRDIRDYVAEARALAQAAGLDGTTSPNLTATLAWAESYADRLDPMRALRDAALARAVARKPE